MQLTSYISSATSEKLTLAEATWQEFHPFLARYQWASENPSHSPRASEIASAILNRGKKGACTFCRPDEAYTYRLPILHTRHFKNAIANCQKIYYASYGSQALLYLDTDIHKVWQTVDDARQAQSLLDRLLTRFFGEPVLFSSTSTLGGNDYMKVNLCGMEYEKVNKSFSRLEVALQLFLAFCGNLADFEIKGTMGFLKDGEYVWGKYGKLPIHQNWNFKRLEEFKCKPPVSIYGLEALCRQIEAQVPLEVLERHNACKKIKGDEPFIKGNDFLVTPSIEKAIVERYGDAWRCMYECGEDQDGRIWLDRRYYRPREVPLTVGEWREEWAKSRSQPTIVQPQPEPSEEFTRKQAALPDEQPIKAPASPLKINIRVADLASEPDSFKRQKEALFRYVRYLKRVPTIDEALKYLHQEKQFTGRWEENHARRRRRVLDILKWISNTFDASKCANGSVNIGKYDEWARKKFPQGLIGRTRSSLSEFSNEIEGQVVHVSHKFIAVFMSVCEFALITNKNLDNSLPHKRASELWEALYAKGLVSVPFCARKWAVCREQMVWHGIVVITDRDYHSGKAMRWAVGPYFPFLGLWKRSKVKSLQGSGSFRRRLKRKEQGHNTLLRQQRRTISSEAIWVPARPPP